MPVGHTFLWKDNKWTFWLVSNPESKMPLRNMNFGSGLNIAVTFPNILHKSAFNTSNLTKEQLLQFKEIGAQGPMLSFTPMPQLTTEQLIEIRKKHVGPKFEPKGNIM